MLGSIIGDIAGSSYEVSEILAKKNGATVPYEERIKILNKNVPLFNENSSYTDDSVLTCAIADAILTDGNYEKKLKEYGIKEFNLGLDKYGRSRFGKGFVEWVQGNYQGISFGNGSAMRISPVGFYYNSLNDVLSNARLATIPSHNNEESIKSAQATAGAIYFARNNKSKNDIKKFVENIFGFELNYDIGDLQRNYTFTSKAINSVPQAIYCFLISNDFEDCIRKAISIGGDTDTIACISGGIAEAYYGVPENIKNEANEFVPKYMSDIMNNFYSKINSRGKSY